MKLEKIITQANSAVRLEFLAMERSLRATGCTLPILVIPYDDKTFDLPAGANWWADAELYGWLQTYACHPGYRKYQCLTTANYQFVDTDVCFLQNPESVLAPHEGFITCCGHWRNTEHAVTERSREILAARTTNWQKNVFNAGQFACDRALYSQESLRRIAADSRYHECVLLNPSHEQVGLNVLVALSGVPVTNLTLPPTHMESSWAGDYPGEFEPFWKTGHKPYLIHWAGGIAQNNPPINELFLSVLSADEREEWRRNQLAKKKGRESSRAMLRKAARRLRSAGRAFRHG